MYEKFFSLQRTPFSMVPDPDCIHVTGQHADAISGAVFGILERRGCVVLTAEPGLGKTTAIRAVSGLLAESNAEVSLIAHPTLNASEFLELAMLNFGLPPVAASKAQRLKALESFLTAADAAGKVCVLIIDEAHKLTPEALEEVRLLGNFETANHKLLQILLAGQNELNARLDLPELWQLKQRIAFRLSLERLDRDGVEDYIAFRWSKAGGKALPFDAEALDAIATWSMGTPRVINAICDNALMLALSDAVRAVGVDLIREVCEHLHLATPPILRSRPDLREQDWFLHENPEPEAEEPWLVHKAAGGAARLAVLPQPGKSEKSPASSLAPLQARPESGFAPEPWSQSRPSLLKKWLGFLEEQKSAPSLKSSDILSLKRR